MTLTDLEWEFLKRLSVEPWARRGLITAWSPPWWKRAMWKRAHCRQAVWNTKSQRPAWRLSRMPNRPSLTSGFSLARDRRVRNDPPAGRDRA
jgi:hypothetical protein